MIIAVDSGKFAGKACYNNGGKIENVYLRNKVDIMDNASYDAIDSKTYNVKFNDVNYIIGDEANTNDLSTTKVAFNHKIMAYTLIGKCLPSSKMEKVNLVISLPIVEFKNKDTKNKFIEDLRGDDGLIKIKINNEERQFYLESVTILPESCGIVYQNLDRFRNDYIYIIDVGGLNGNFSVFNNNKLDRDLSFTGNYGGMILHNEIRDALNTEESANYQQFEVEKAILNKNKVAEKIIKLNIKEMKNELLGKGWNLNNKDNKVIFTGGCVNILKDYIGDYFINYEISKNNQFDNVLGMLNFGEMYYGKTN